MARKIYSVEVQTDDGKQTFHYRKPSGLLMLKQSDKFKKDALTNEQSTRDLYAECLTDSEGTPITKDRLVEILDMEWDVIQALNAVLMPPKDEQKNG